MAILRRMGTLLPADRRFGGRLGGWFAAVAIAGVGLAACSRPTPAPVVYKDRIVEAAQPAPRRTAPVTQAPAAAKTPLPAQGSTVGGRTVTVRPGDTVYAVSRREQVPLRALIEVNRLRPPYRLAVGQTLQVPRVRIHYVGEGETLYGISRRYDVDLYRLAKTNGIKHPYGVTLGDRLAVPLARAGASQRAKAPRRPRPTRLGASSRRMPKARPAATPLPARASSKFAWPVRGRVISSFGVKRGGLHNDGINIAVTRGAPVRAAENGVVAYAGNELPGFGNLLLIRHAGGYTTAYAHSARILVRRGQRVKRGQIVARAGSTGGVDRPQLHFEIRKGSKAVNPLRHLAGPTAAKRPVRTPS